jgi:TPR repeat protein
MTEKILNSLLNKAEKLYKSQKYTEAYPLFEDLANKGVIKAQYRLGCIYDGGYLNNGVEDFDLAVYWFRKGALQNDIDSQYNLAGYFCTGEGVEFSNADAYFWYRRSTRLGDADSMERIDAIKNTISKNNFKKCTYIVRGYEFNSINDAVENLIKGWNSERICDLILYIDNIWNIKNNKYLKERHTLKIKDLMLIISNIPLESGYELLADIIEYEYYEQDCINDIEKLIKKFTLLSIYSKNEEELIYGEDISLFKELKIAFDGYSENEEDLTNNSRSYVTYIHTDSLDGSFVFPEHEKTIIGVIHRTGKEVHIFSWFDLEKNELEVINIDDHINNAKMSIVNIRKILIQLGKKYKIINEEGEIINSNLTNEFELNYTLLASLKYFEYEKIGEKPSINEANVNASNIYKIANSSAEALKEIGRTIKEVYVGIYPNYSNLYAINLPMLKGKKSSKVMENKAISDFLESSKEELIEIWPGELERISITFKFADGKSIPTDSDMLNFSRLANVDCEAMIRLPSLGTLVIQGYEGGDYDTGYISNDEDEIYLMRNDYQKFLVDLQDPLIINERIIKNNN